MPEDCIAEGFRRASKKEMLRKIAMSGVNENYRVSDRASNQRGIISEARKRYIRERLHRELIYDFRHNLYDDSEYGIVYE